ncbi:MAG: DNA sulfur modification protein DndB [Carboxydocellales bacterium]
METNFTYSFPAIKGVQGRKEYFVVMCPLKLIPKIFLFNEEEIPPEYRAQRVVNKSRIPEIAEYILENPGDYAFSSLTASIDGDMHFIPYADSSNFTNIGKLVISMDTRFLINDGQHRRAAIEEAIKLNPDLGNETISVVFYKDEGLKRSQQIFSDLNRHAVNTTRSIGILYDSRDELALLTKETIDTIPLLKTLTDKENSSLSKFSPKIFTLSNIHSTNCRLIGKKKGDRVTDIDKNTVIVFWEIMCSTITEWNFVLLKKLSAVDLRNDYIHSHGIVLEAVATTANYMIQNNLLEWPYNLRKLNTIDWSRSNTKDWLDRAFNTYGRINKNSNCIRLTAIKIKQLLDIQLTPEEIQTEKIFQKSKGDIEKL